MKRALFFFISIICLTTISLQSNAQNYKWMKGGGSDEDMSSFPDGTERVQSMCTDDNGNIYITAITGASNITADTFYIPEAQDHYPAIIHTLIASYTCDGTMRWARLLQSINGADYSWQRSLSYSHGSIYFSGSLYGGNKYIGYDTMISSWYLLSYTTRFDTSGNFKWIRFIGVDSPSNELTTGDPGVVAIDGQGYIHNFNNIKAGTTLSTTQVTDTSGTYDLKYDTAGNLVSAKKLPIDSVWWMQKVIFDKNDGKFYSLFAPDFSYWYKSYWYDQFCAFKPDESVLWTDSISVGSQVQGFDYKGGNQIYLAGFANYPDTFHIRGMSITNTVYPTYYNVAVVCRLDTNGTPVWMYGLQSNEGVDNFYDATILPNGKVAVVGTGLDTAIHGTDTITTLHTEYANPLLLVVDTNGNTIKLDQAHGDGSDLGWAITSDKVGNVYMGGEVADSITATGLSAYHSHGGNTDFFIWKYGVDCNCTSIATANFSYTGTATVNFTYNGTSGYDSLRWEFGDGSTSTTVNPSHTYSATGPHHVCVSVYSACGNDTYCEEINAPVGVENLAQGDLELFPNPATNSLTLRCASTMKQISISSILGQMVVNVLPNTKQAQVDITNLAPGIYLVKVNGTIVRKFVKQ